MTSNECFEDIQDGIVVWDYDVQGISTGPHCSGTDHQDIQGIERIVYLGDSIMNGTPPTPANDFVRSRLDRRLKELFPGAASQSCARNGERNADLMASQIPNCFPENVRSARTLTLIISGGNDIAALARDKPELAQATAAANGYVNQLRSAVEWLKDSSRFPAGNDVVFANVYEYTDTSADLSSCPLANLVGLSGTWLNGAAVLTGMNEGYAKIAADTGADMVFMMETFCGHGYRAGRTDLQCYRGPGAENWFDISCIHPTPTGHNEIFKLFMNVIEN
ncbi:MAG: SGNH/GDSL hydrolase family protein [Polyangiaceae bacterium]|nr:SGNH/GDSL hydrolase family protein [Polyangiaceae bacterium]